MTIFKEYSNEMKLDLAPGQQEHVVLINPRNMVLHADQHEGSCLTIHCISLDGQDAVIDLTAIQHEAHCETRIYGLGLLHGHQHHSLTTHVLHQHNASSANANANANTNTNTNTNAYSDQLIKNILLDDATGSFYGELKVMPDAQKTEAHQTNRNILLSRSARMNTKPQLEIYADDVKCSHGATTGQLDEQALFYMQQRGISRQTAQRLLLTAFLQDVLNTLPEETAPHGATSPNETSLQELLAQEIDNLLS